MTRASRAVAAVRSLSSKIASILSSEQSEIDQLRVRIADLSEQRRKIDDAHPSPAEIEARADQLIDHCLSVAPPFFDMLAARAGLPTAGSISEAAQRHPIAWQAVINREGLRRAMLAGQPTDGIDAADRAAQLADLDAQILQLCCQEELQLRQIEQASGGHSRRRRDAPPAVLVAPSSELEAAASPGFVN